MASLIRLGFQGRGHTINTTSCWGPVYENEAWCNAKRGRQRQGEGHNEENNRSARAFYILVHFFAVLCKTLHNVKWPNLCFLENVSSLRQMFIVLFFL